MSSDQPQFDDPALKEALRRACAGEKAPPQLRSRVIDALAAQQPPAAVVRRSWRNNPLIGLAAAALIILSIGLIYNNYREATPPVYEVTLPEQLAHAMVLRYEQGPASIETNLVSASAPDYDALARTLRERVNHAVVASSLGPQWTLKAAGISKIDDTAVAHLIYTRGDESISLFSVSGGNFYAPREGSGYDQEQDGHPIAGFVHKGAVHCIVGGSKASLKQISKLRDQLRNSLVALQQSSGGCDGKSDPNQI